MLELHLYDMDSTLLRSPPQPEDWKGDWWSHPHSLEEPFMPPEPPEPMWIQSTVRAARRSIADQNVLAVLATGRTDKNFRWRVPELMKSVGLVFDRVHLAPGGSTRTETFKLAVLRSYLSKFDFGVVHIWEDRPDHLVSFCKFVEGTGVECVPHLVRT